MSEIYQNKLVDPFGQRKENPFSQFIMPPEYDMDKERADWDAQGLLTQTLIVTLNNFNDVAWGSKTLCCNSFDQPRGKTGCIFQTILFKTRYVIHIELHHLNGKWLWWLINTDPEIISHPFTQENTILTWVILQTNDTLRAYLPDFIKETSFREDKVNLAQSDAVCKHDILMLYALYVDKTKWKSFKKTIKIGNLEAEIEYNSWKCDLTMNTGCSFGLYIRAAVCDLIIANNDNRTGPDFDVDPNIVSIIGPGRTSPSFTSDDDELVGINNIVKPKVFTEEMDKPKSAAQPKRRKTGRKQHKK